MKLEKIDIVKKNSFLLDETIKTLNDDNVSWFASYGTLLGVIRDRKLISWDDDSDIMVPREDYNKLLKNGSSWFKGPLFFQTVQTDDYCRYYTRIRLSGTTAISEWEDINHGHHGMVLDIFPIDHVPNDKNKRNRVVSLRNNFCAQLSSVIGKTRTKLSLEAFVFYNDFMTKIDKENSESEYLVSSGDPSFLNDSCLFFKDMFSDYEEINIDGVSESIRVPKECDKVLEIMYGENWRTPVDYKRGNKVFVDPFNDFSVYKKLKREDLRRLIEDENA